MEDLQQQLAQARMVISHLAAQLDHHKDVQHQLAGPSLCLLNSLTRMASVICSCIEINQCQTHLKLLCIHGPFRFLVWCQFRMLALP